MSIPINSVVDVTVSIGGLSAPRVDFSKGLILGSSAVISTANRTAVYATLAEMVTAGFQTTDKEYLAAAKYFAQSPAPEDVVIGVKGSEETIAEALSLCRTDNEDWYGCAVCCTYDDTDIAAVALAVEGFAIPSFYIFEDDDADALIADGAAVSNNFKTLKVAGYRRTIGIYSDPDTQLASALLGRICGLNSYDDNSAYTLGFKSLTGATVAAINGTQLTNLKVFNGNAYVEFSGRYSMFVPGVMASGIHFDELYAIDVLKKLIEENVIAVLYGTAIIPQTDNGVSRIAAKAAEACQQVKDMGYIAPGIWNAATVKTLKEGDALPNGYTIIVDPVAEQSQIDREARVTPTIYVCVKLAGANESVAISVYVNR